jgi:hypothetical protein
MAAQSGWESSDGDATFGPGEVGGVGLWNCAQSAEGKYVDWVRESGLLEISQDNNFRDVGIADNKSVK